MCTNDHHEQKGQVAGRLAVSLVIWYGLRYHLDSLLLHEMMASVEERLGSDHGVFFISGTYKHYGE